MTGWKKKLVDDLIDYWINVAYLTVFFGVFVTYTRLVLRHYSIDLLHYGVSVIEALVLAKVILIIDAMKLGRKLEDKSLAWSTLYKATFFTIGVFLFNIIEHVIRGYWGKGLPGVMEELTAVDKYLLLAKCMVIFFAFIPFFAFKEIGRILGKDKLSQMFLHRSS